MSVKSLSLLNSKIGVVRIATYIRWPIRTTSDAHPLMPSRKLTLKDFCIS